VSAYAEFCPECCRQLVLWNRPGIQLQFRLGVLAVYIEDQTPFHIGRQTHRVSDTDHQADRVGVQSPHSSEDHHHGNGDQQPHGAVQQAEPRDVRESRAHVHCYLTPALPIGSKPTRSASTATISDILSNRVECFIDEYLGNFRAPTILALGNGR
jgi:hypothetical protein